MCASNKIHACSSGVAVKNALLSVLINAVAAGQWSDSARIEQHGTSVTLIADTFRPVDAMGQTLAHSFGLPVSTEDPLWQYPGDMKDVSVEVPRLRKGAFVPRGGKLVFTFDVGEGGSITDPAAVMRSLVEAIHAQLPFRYRLDDEKDRFTLVPVRARNERGEMVDVVPLLDRPVTIPFAIRRVRDHARLVAESLSAQTGLRVNCCEAFVAGVPWGLQEITFGAAGLPARDVLKQLFDHAGGHRRLWFSRCDMSGCFINLRPPGNR